MIEIHLRTEKHDGELCRISVTLNGSRDTANIFKHFSMKHLAFIILPSMCTHAGVCVHKPHMQPWAQQHVRRVKHARVCAPRCPHVPTHRLMNYKSWRCSRSALHSLMLFFLPFMSSNIDSTISSRGSWFVIWNGYHQKYMHIWQTKLMRN